jgi:hypothetical protein
VIAISASDAIGTIRESLRCSLRAAGLVVPEPALTELRYEQLLSPRDARTRSTLVVSSVEVREARDDSSAEQMRRLLRACMWFGYDAGGLVPRLFATRSGKHCAGAASVMLVVIAGRDEHDAILP